MASNDAVIVGGGTVGVEIALDVCARPPRAVGGLRSVDRLLRAGRAASKK